MTSIPRWFPRGGWLLCLGAALLCACASDQPTPDVADTQIPQTGGTFTIALESVTTLDPALVDDVYTATIVNQMYSGLVRWDADLNVVPDLAYSWTISRDGLNYAFELLPGAKFHHGREVTAEDFVASFERLFRPEIPPGIIQDYLIKIDGVQEFIDGTADHIAGLTASGPHSLHIRLHSPYPSFLSVLCMDQAKVLPLELIPDPTSFSAHIGTGPFQLEDWVPDERVVLVRNANYFGTKARLDTLIIRHYPAEGQIDLTMADFLAGRLDTREVRDSEVAQMQSGTGMNVVRRLELSMEFLGFNVDLPPFNDPRVRRAVAHAMNYAELERVAGTGFMRPVGLLPPGMAGYTPEPKLLDEDVVEARRLLADAGYSALNPLRFDILTSSRSVHAVMRDSVVVNSLARAGIIAEVQNVGWHELNEAIDNKTAPAFQITWIADLPDPDSFLYTLLASEGVYNMFDYRNARVDSLLEAGRGELNVALRLDRYRESERLVLADAPLVPLFNVMTVYGFQPWVRGIEMSPFGICSVPLHKVWMQMPLPEDLYAGR